MISVSKDGTWRFFDTRVEYDKGQEPYLLNSGKFSVTGCSSSQDYCTVALSPDARVAAVACLNSISVFSTSTGEFFVALFCKNVFVRDFGFNSDHHVYASNFNRTQTSVCFTQYNYNTT